MGTNANYTLEDNLALTNEELTSNWAKLASFVKLYEGIHWDEARPKAIDLLRFGKAIEYIEQVRSIVSGQLKDTSNSPSEKVKEELATSIQTIKKPTVKASKPVDIHQSNFIKLLRIVPDLEERIQSGEDVYGKSKRTGYMDFNLELLHQDKTGYYISISHYYKENGDMIADPDMELLVNLKNKTIIPLAYQDRYKYKLTFDDVYNRKLVNPKELKAQASFLSFWLGNLKKQGHKIKWKESDGTGEIKKDIPIEEPTKLEVQEETIIQEPIVKEEQQAIEAIVKHWKRLASFIKKQEGISQVEAEVKARELGAEDKAWDYVEMMFEKNKKVSDESLFRENYKTLIALIPDLREYIRDESMKGILSSSKPKLMGYEISRAKELNSTTSCIAIFETPQKQVDTLGILILAVNRIRKMAWIHLLDGNFFGMDSYDNSEALREGKLRYSINKKIGRWLDLLLERKYTMEWQHVKAVEESVPNETEKNHDDEEVNNQKVGINKDIPDFEPGEVELTETHRRAGLTQKHINWINKHKQGMVITPRRNMTNNTSDFHMDSKITAKRPGFRVSKTGKLYYEGRSNRSDLTKGGL